MSMFDDLIPKPQPPQPTLPNDPMTGMTTPKPRLTAGSNDYGRGQVFPTDPAIPSMPQEPQFTAMDGGRMVAPTPTLADQISTPSLAELIASGGNVSRGLTSQDRALLNSRLRSAIDGVEGAPGLSELFTSVIAGIEDGTFDSPIAAERYATDPANWVPETQEVVTNPPGTMLSRLFGMDDGVPDAVSQQPTGRVNLKAPQKAAADMTPEQVLQQAREAIKVHKKDRGSVINRVIEMGIDPAGL